MTTLLLTEKRNVVADIWSFTFSVPPNLVWSGGCHTVVMLDHQNPDDRGTARALSIASLPFEHAITFLTHCPEECSTFKRALRNLPTGGSVTITPPQPSFATPWESGRAVFIVGGVGSAAVRSLLVERDREGASFDARVIYHAPKGEHLFQEDFNALAKKHPDLTVEYRVVNDLHEQGGVKQVSQQPGAKFYFSGVYTREMLLHDEIAEHVAGPASPEREEVEAMAKMSGLLK
jgi:ferredoxin-NADP reductase